MTNHKIILTAEVPVKPEFLEEVKAFSRAAIEPTLLEPGCEVFCCSVIAVVERMYLCEPVMCIKDALYKVVE